MAAPMGNASFTSSESKGMRSCEEYLALWKDCANWRNKFHEYYIHGEWPNCAQSKENYNDCILWTTEHCQSAKERLLQSEKQQAVTSEDMKAVWKLRTEPYSGWKTPRKVDGSASPSAVR